ncbi:ABC transporter ATP-binding protein [Halomarina halobia]|uniref:Molybdate/tungstate import ATP-binding protein WtpC n=1 Tax=Halomarina halobia TaxID=3033386 RepID=A0ABD6AGJ8_9EURY|nr:ABC transporter ATP-binding protein [Halomarina sp. PSR21]
MSSVIDLDGVQKEFADVTAVKDVDLQIEDGEFFTLLGPSGSGKTTVLRMVAGFEQPTEGTIRLAGTDVTDKPPYDRAVHTVFQDYALFPHMTVHENIAYGLELQGVSAGEIDRRVTELLDLVSLAGLGGRSIDELSGGQQQRVALARALAVKPKVLLLDEPLGALDEKLRREMQVELKDIQETLGTTFLYVTHDQEEALSMSDRLAVLEAGNVIQVGPPEEVYEHPRTAFIAEFFRGSNIFTGEITSSDERMVTLSFAGIEIVVYTEPDRSLAVGENVTFFVRSENIVAGDGRSNAVDGEITNIVYRGSVTDYTVRIDADHEFVASLGDERFSKGDKLTLSWAPSDAIILHDEPTQC